jgi:hypothetical protein
MTVSHLNTGQDANRSELRKHRSSAKGGEIRPFSIPKTADPFSCGTESMERYSAHASESLNLMTNPSNSDNILKRLADGIHFDSDGFNSDGLCSRGYDRDGFYPNGWSIEGLNQVTGSRFDADHWSHDRIHEFTGTRFTPEGLSWIETLPARDADGFDHQGYDRRGLNRRGFSRLGIHFETRTEFDPNGFNEEGFDADGADEDGFYSYEATHELMGLNKFTGTKYDIYGFDDQGLDANGFDSAGMFWG